MNTANISRPENRWAGSNRGAWVNAEYDRLIDHWRKKERDEFARIKPKGADDPGLQALLARLAAMG